MKQRGVCITVYSLSPPKILPRLEGSWEVRVSVFVGWTGSFLTSHLAPTHTSGCTLLLLPQSQQQQPPHRKLIPQQ